MTEDTEGPDPDNTGTGGDSDAGGRVERLVAAIGRPSPGHRAVYLAGVLVIAVLLAPFVAFAVPQLVGATASYVVVSDSMNDQPAPVLSAGDVVFVYDTPPERIEAGDVVTYRSQGEQVTTHRVVGVDDTDGLYFRTKGDANEEADPRLVPADRVVGTVDTNVPPVGHTYAAVPYVGHVITFAGTTRGFVALVALPVALLLVGEVWTVVSARRTRSGPNDPADGHAPGEGQSAGADDPVPEGPDRPADPDAPGAAATPPPQDQSAPTLTLTRTDLRLTLVVTAAFAAYSSWIAFLVRRVWTTVVATTALAMLLLFASLSYSDGQSDPPAPARSATDGGHEPGDRGRDAQTGDGGTES